MISSALFIFQPTQSIGSFSRPILKANQLWLRETNKLLPSLPQLLQPTNEIQACNLGRKHLERIWSNICSCLANAILNQKGNVWLYKGCLIDREAKIRLDSNVGGLCYICIIHQVLTTDPFIDSPPLAWRHHSVCVWFPIKYTRKYNMVTPDCEWNPSKSAITLVINPK